MALALRSLHALVNQDGSVDARYPNGDKPFVQPSSLGINLAAFQSANINLLKQPQNTLQDYNYRQYLTGTSAATATLSVLPASGSIQNWVIDNAGNGPTNPSTAIGSGVLFVRADDGAGHVVDFPQQAWSILAPAQQTKKKWNPGHYLASVGTYKRGQTLANFQTEMDHVNDSLSIIGYRLFTSWAALDLGPQSFTGSVGGATTGTLTTTIASGVYFVDFGNSQYRSVTVSGLTCTWTGALPAGSITSGGFYTFDVLDAALNRLKTAYAAPKHLVAALQVMSFSAGTLSTGDHSIIPQYITSSSTYGASPNAGVSFGWWGPPPGQANGGYTAALWRSAVANRFTLLVQALGAKYDADPYFEGWMLQEDSAIAGDAQNPLGKAPDYSDAALETQFKAIFTAALAASPSTNIGCQNTWMVTSPPTQDFQGWMLANGVVTCETDTTGQSLCSTRPKIFGSWGLQAYAGITADGNTATFTDKRHLVPCWCDVEGPDLGAYGFGTRFFNGTPIDTIQGANNFYNATHIFWTDLPASSGCPTACVWANLFPLLAVNPVLNTAYPSQAPGY